MHNLTNDSPQRHGVLTSQPVPWGLDSGLTIRAPLHTSTIEKVGGSNKVYAIFFTTKIVAAYAVASQLVWAGQPFAAVFLTGFLALLTVVWHWRARPSSTV